MTPPFNPREFYHLAQQLALPDAGEASLRTAVSRAYYGCFLETRERLAVSAQRGIHQAVISALRRRDRLTGDLLDRLRRSRITADYLLAPPAGQGDWRSNWLQAQVLASRVLARLPNLGL
jgi:hypothetical protein